MIKRTERLLLITATLLIFLQGLCDAQGSAHKKNEALPQARVIVVNFEDYLVEAKNHLKSDILNKDRTAVDQNSIIVRLELN